MSKKTVLVVGAGAGVPYGLPTGSQLLDDICKNPQTTHFKPDLDRMQASILVDRIRGMCDAASCSGQLSIDSFLERRSEFLDQGTVQIAAHLLPKEWDAIRTGRITKDWIGWLYRQLENKTSLRTENISIVTFNYDRLVEVGLAAAMTNSHNIPITQCLSVVDKIPLVHVYRHLLAPNKPEEINHFNGVPNYYWIQHAASGIRIISDDRNASESGIERAKSIIWNADRVVFVGFGFHKINLNRIGADFSSSQWREKVRDIYATAFGLGARIKMQTENFIGTHVTWGDRDQSVFDFLNENIDLS